MTQARIIIVYSQDCGGVSEDVTYAVDIEAAGAYIANVTRGLHSEAIVSISVDFVTIED